MFAGRLFETPGLSKGLDSNKIRHEKSKLRVARDAQEGAPKWI